MVWAFIQEDSEIHYFRSNKGTHESMWGSKESIQMWRGRFDLTTKQCSICVPDVLSNSVADPPYWLIPMLQEKFNDTIKSFWIFNPVLMDEGKEIKQ